MAENKENTRFGSSAKEIAQDFAEQLKYALDADVYHATAEGRYQALAPVASQAKAEYTAYATKINAQNGDPSLTQEAKLNRLKNASSEAEFNYDSALKTALYHTHSATQFLA